MWSRRTGRAWLAAACLVLPWAAPAAPALRWRPLPPLPDPYGFASPFVGVAGNDLVLAGGANFPVKPLDEGGGKVWHDRVFVLRAGASQWMFAGRLPRPMAYGLAISTGDGIICVGGSDAQRHYAEVFLLQWRDGSLAFQPLPPLPQPVAMGAGALVGRVVYLAGGLAAPTSTQALSTFYALDLGRTTAGWRALTTWPGAGRSQAVAASAEGCFYLFSGISYRTGPDGRAVSTFLADAYRYSPIAGWRRLADIPAPAIAAASPAPVADDTIFLIGGADGSAVGRPPQEYRLNPQHIVAYSVRADAWSPAGNAPVGRVCVSTALWRGEWIVPTGERSAGIRSPEIWAARIPAAP